MRTTPLAVNPFMMMMEPEAILQAVERSDRLSRLQRRVCRPLDKPLIPKIVPDEQLAYDLAIDQDDTVDEDEVFED